MNNIAIRILIIGISLVCLFGSILVLSLKKNNLYKKLVLLGTICFAVSSMHLIYTFGFYLENQIEFALSLIGIVAGFLFHISAERVQRDEQFDYSKKSKSISLYASIAIFCVLIVGVIVGKSIEGSEIIVGRFIPFFFIAITSAILFYYLLRNVLSDSKKSKELKTVKIIDCLMIGEIALSFVLAIAMIGNNLLLLGIFYVIYIFVQCVIVYFVYGGKKDE